VRILKAAAVAFVELLPRPAASPSGLDICHDSIFLLATIPRFRMLSLLFVWSLLATYVCAKSFKLELTWKKGAPDGFTRNMIYVNDQFPGPKLDIKQNEWVEISVKNKLPFNTTIHFHGMHTNTWPPRRIH
jgi:FtsP/CotA-like multicopper oxidase with cupredoxin domain